MSEPKEPRRMGWPHWLVLGSVLAWAASFAGSAVLPDLMMRPGASHWDALGYFILWQMIAAGVSVVGLILTVVLRVMERIGNWIAVLGCLPALVTACGLIWLAVAE